MCVQALQLYGPGKEWGHTGWLSLLRFALTHAAQPLQNPAACVCERDFSLWDQDFVTARSLQEWFCDSVRRCLAPNAHECSQLLPCWAPYSWKHSQSGLKCRAESPAATPTQPCLRRASVRNIAAHLLCQHSAAAGAEHCQHWAML